MVRRDMRDVSSLRSFGLDKGSLNMDTLEVIYTRRSIRKYTENLVSWGLVIELLKVAMSAPSAVNANPWVLHCY